MSSSIPPTLPLRSIRFLVTGSGRGLGRGIATALLAQGASVLALSRTKADLDALATEHVAQSCPQGDLAVQPGSILDSDQLALAVDRCQQQFGGLDVLIANAGVYGPRQAFHEAADVEWEDALLANILGLSRSCRSCIPALSNSSRGQILVIGSAIGHTSGRNSSAYALSKAMSWSLVKCLSLELEPLGIAVNELIPGPVHTAMNPGSENLPFCRWPQDAAFSGLITYLCTGCGRPPSGQSFSLRTNP